MLATTEAYGLTFQYPAGDATVGRYLRDYGEFSRVAAVFAGQVVGDGVFLDVGANIGTIALPVAERARMVLAIEAHRGLAEILRGNVERNGLTNVQVLHAAAGRAAGHVEFPTPPLDLRMNFGGVGIGADYPLEQVPMVALDEIAPANTTCIKIDVEGYEPEVLAGAGRLLRQTRPVWIVESPDTPSGRQVIAQFINAQYRLYWFFTPFFTPHSPRSGGRERIQGDVNIVAVAAEKPQPQEMRPVTLGGIRPSSLADYPYLRRFGFSISPASGR